MKKFLCVMLACLLTLSMAACKNSVDETPDPTQAPTEPVKQALSECGAWVVAKEYELSSSKSRDYRYDSQGNLLGYDDYQATSEANDLGGKTVTLIPYDKDGKVITHLSKHMYIYDEAGRLVKYQRNEGKTGNLADNFVFEYNSDGKMVKQTKYYMTNFHEEITYTYEGEKLTKSTFRSTVHEAEYTYIYDSEGVPSQVNFLVEYVKSDNEIKGSLVLLKSVYESDTVRRVTLSASNESTGIEQGKEVLVYQEHYDEQGKVLRVEIELLQWELFQIAWMPMRQLGAMNPTNMSGGTAKLVYQPLSVYWANQK